MTSSKTLGKNISAVEITNISNNGVWLLTGDKELFMSYEDFPWFKDAPIGKILNELNKALLDYYMFFFIKFTRSS